MLKKNKITKIVKNKHVTQKGKSRYMCRNTRKIT